MNKLLEIACFNLESALLAQSAGADRIELCENYKEGGTTPSENLILDARQNISIPIYVIIRPRGGNFIYRESELNEMRKSILFCKENKIDGVVFGILNIKSEVDEEICKELIALAKPIQVTFHRAIDLCAFLKPEIDKLISIGFNKLLSSGGKNTAIEGSDVLKELQKEFGAKITIMPGGRIRSGNISEIINTTKCNEFHSAAITGNNDIADINEIKALRKILSSC